MSLVPDYENSSSSSLGTDSECETETVTKKKDQKNKLPAPNFGSSSHLTELEESKFSVFTNPYIEAENAKEAILQKHVKMVELKDNVVVINGKKICWNYRKGKCRFGHNCKYAHDSDIQKTELQIQEEKVAALNCPDAVVCESGIKPKYVKKDDVGNEKRTGNKKRPGLSQTLIPGKKVMKQYMNQKT